MELVEKMGYIVKTGGWQ